MDPKYLKRDELEYELSARGYENLSAYAIHAMSNVLTDILSKEKFGTLEKKFVTPLDATREVEICTVKIETLTDLIQDGSTFDNDAKKRNLSLISHLMGRLARLITEDKNLLAARENLRAQLDF